MKGYLGGRGQISRELFRGDIIYTIYEKEVEEF